MNKDPSKGVIWIGEGGKIVDEKDARYGEVWINGESQIVIPSRPEKSKPKTKRSRKTRRA